MLNRSQNSVKEPTLMNSGSWFPQLDDPLSDLQELYNTRGRSVNYGWDAFDEFKSIDDQLINDVISRLE